MRWNIANVERLVCPAKSVNSISQIPHVNDQEYQVKKTIHNKLSVFIQYKSSQSAFAFKVYHEESKNFSKLVKKLPKLPKQFSL